MTPGARMIRLDDGRRGWVEEFMGENRIVYFDRGEKLVAPKREKWIPEDSPRQPLRKEEIREIALEADRALRAIEKHEPRRWWQAVRLDAPPYDEGLVAVIEEYLLAR